jgi:hypothetical protein
VLSECYQGLNKGMGPNHMVKGLLPNLDSHGSPDRLPSCSL